MHDPDDQVFGALNDPSRRRLLDELLRADGQTLTELCTHLPTMTRYGVMNHLNVLETAGLVATHKVGRHKHHYLNPVPIQHIYERWLTKFTGAVTGALTALKIQLESEQGDNKMSIADTKPSHVHETFIAAPSDAIWEALTDGKITVDYFYGTAVDSTWEVGAAVTYWSTDDEPILVADGEVIAVDTHKMLALSFLPRWDPDLEAEGPVHMTWLISDAGPGVCNVRVEYRDMNPTGAIAAAFVPGIAFIMAGLKTRLETGAAMGAG